MIIINSNELGWSMSQSGLDDNILIFSGPWPSPVLPRGNDSPIVFTLSGVRRKYKSEM